MNIKKTAKEVFIDYLSKKGMIVKRQLHPDISKAFDIALNKVIKEKGCKHYKKNKCTAIKPIDKILREKEKEYEEDRKKVEKSMNNVIKEKCKIIIDLERELKNCKVMLSKADDIILEKQ